MIKRAPGSFTRVAMSCAMLLCISPAFVQAQAIDAPRYVNAQGVEVIQGRRAARPAPTAGVGSEDGNASGPVSRALAIPKSAEPARATAAGYQIAAGEQQQRDRDRLSILEQEMHAENVALESKIRVLQDPAMRAKLDAEQFKRLQETTLAHEKNIRALHSEIARVKKNR
ncbi:hypothetical protein [Massilia arenae]|uniref:DUF4124 domain-containing protein n=1 Tax=Massilia arenae TaxID=2603288 RepID=A0A5C7FX67_9BURK|nr:hypothetical protein [Massilia arenae]TXF99526.1 hypothetical protein FVD38_11920 [Massilia arenae]